MRVTKRKGEMRRMLLKLRKAGSLSSDLCKWNPGNGKWYPILRGNMKVEGDLKDQCNLFNALLSGLIATVKGVYDRKQKKLSLRL